MENEKVLQLQTIRPAKISIYTVSMVTIAASCRASGSGPFGQAMAGPTFREVLKVAYKRTQLWLIEL